MRRSKNKDRILTETLELFNREGVASTSTNHICRYLKISPGNLYFHHPNKESLVLALFQIMCDEIEVLWRNAMQCERLPGPLTLLGESLQIFWRYRFFHREMYDLRRRDPRLAHQWQQHLTRTRRFMRAAYSRWVREGAMKRVSDAKNLRMIADIVIVTASSFFQFYESAAKPAKATPVRLAINYVEFVLAPYLR